jgi:hypothetical protein
MYNVLTVQIDHALKHAKYHKADEVFVILVVGPLDYVGETAAVHEFQDHPHFVSIFEYF